MTTGIPEAAARAVLEVTGDAWHARTLREFAVASSNGFGDFVTDAVAVLTGHAPRSLRDFAREELNHAISELVEERLYDASAARPTARM